MQEGQMLATLWVEIFNGGILFGGCVQVATIPTS